MSITIIEQKDLFLEALKAFQEGGIQKDQKKSAFLSRVQVLAQREEGIALLYEYIDQIVEAGIFKGTPWASPGHLVPQLVEGTLLSGYPTPQLELLSELRLLAIANERIDHPTFSAEDAETFLELAMAAAFSLVSDALSEQPGRAPVYTQTLFRFLTKRIPPESFKARLLDEVETICGHRPIVLSKAYQILEFVHKKMTLVPGQPVDDMLGSYIQAAFQPTEASRAFPTIAGYASFLRNTIRRKILSEAQRMGSTFRKTGLVSSYQLVLLKECGTHYSDIIPEILQLDAHGRAEYRRHKSFVKLLVEEFIHPDYREALAGLAAVLERNLFSREPSWNAFNRLIRLQLHEEARQILSGFIPRGSDMTAMQALVGGVLSLLGHPLGVRQGNNPTCQSARGLSMWSRHAPAKLINLLMDAARSHNIVFRYEGDLLESHTIQEGLIRQFDPKLDPVSLIMVPQLDRIYAEMMRRASLKHPGKDPHISVNPAFYGHWIQTGFKSVYNPLTHQIEKYDEFVRVFLASFHPLYNDGHHLVYPVPVGIFITDSEGGFLGYHAISLLRMEENEAGEWRAYFFNPNSEGPQNWGQEIRPSVIGNGEEAGESSLPAEQFASRVYAYHYNSLRLGNKPSQVPESLVRSITILARESWGRRYSWVGNNFLS
jgi:hypothetical protein